MRKTCIQSLTQSKQALSTSHYQGLNQLLIDANNLLAALLNADIKTLKGNYKQLPVPTTSLISF